MKRFVEFVPKFDVWGDRIRIEDTINKIANDHDLTIITIAPTGDGVYVVFERNGEHNG
jgi:hypothetical protein